MKRVCDREKAMRRVHHRVPLTASKATVTTADRPIASLTDEREKNNTAAQGTASVAGRLRSTQ
jgi:hypothetical protein